MLQIWCATQACYRCGNVGHFGRDPTFPARGKTWKKCGGADHFTQKCKHKKPPNLPKPRHGVLCDYKEIFEGAGKFRDYQVKLHVDPEVTALAQPVRRTPFSLRENVKKKIEELIAMDIIEPLEGPTPWVSPVVVVPKHNDEIRLCVDMRRTNEAIVTRYPQRTKYSKTSTSFQ